MSNIIQPNTPEFAQHSNLILNAKAIWQKALTNSNSTLKFADYKSISADVLKVRKKVLNGISDLMSKGLTRSEQMATMLSGVESVNDFTQANSSMNPVLTDNEDTTFKQDYVPLPITYKGWSIPMRQLGFGYKNQMGNENAARAVAEKLEQMVFNGDTGQKVTDKDSSTQYTIYGYTTAPNISTVTVTNWQTPSNYTTIYKDVIKMTGKMRNECSNSVPNSCILYVSSADIGILDNDYKDAVHGTIKQRLLDIDIIAEVKPSPNLAVGNTVLVEMERRTVELVMAQDIITIPHQRISDLDDQRFTTYAVMSPHIKTDRASKTGVVYGSV
jgi:hypothetical protein